LFRFDLIILNSCPFDSISWLISSTLTVHGEPAYALTFLVGGLVLVDLLMADCFHLFVVAFDLLERLLNVLGPVEEG